MMRKGSYIAIALIVSTVLGCASSPASAHGGVPRTVRRFLDDHGWDLSAYEQSDLSDLDRYYRHDRFYVVGAPLDELWNLYVSIDPRLAWRTDKTGFGLVWDPAGDALYRAGDDVVPPFAVGQVMVLELEIAGFYRLPVAFRVTEIDRAAAVIGFVYLAENKSNGMQRIGFSSAVDSSGRRYTTIQHSTWYRSGDDFRDRRLYGGFHESIIDAFHDAIAASAGYSIEVVEP